MKIGDDIKAVWVASVPRTGSMWSYNVARDLVRATGRQALPEIVPHADEEMEAVGRAGISASDEGIYVLKVHTRIAADLPRSFFIVTHRDLRDAAVSFMRFTKADFEAGLRFIASAILLERHFATFPAERTLSLDYTRIVSRPAETVAEIGAALGMNVTAEQAATIAERYSKTNVQARLVEREQALRTRIGANQPVDVREFVRAADKSLRAFDTSTGFQSGHVSAYEEGDWRKILTPGQQARMEAVIEAGMERTDSGRRS